MYKSQFLSRTGSGFKYSQWNSSTQVHTLLRLEIRSHPCFGIWNITSAIEFTCVSNLLKIFWPILRLSIYVSVTNVPTLENVRVCLQQITILQRRPRNKLITNSHKEFMTTGVQVCLPHNQGKKHRGQVRYIFKWNCFLVFLYHVQQR